jgi:hypothetical protein
MKIIYDLDTLTDNVTSVSASTEDAGFPAVNLLDDYTTNLWKATTTWARISVAVSRGSAVALLNTNATSATVGVGGGYWDDESGYSLELGYFNEYGATAAVVYSLSGVAGRLWADYPEILTPHIITIELQGIANLTAGIVRAGMVNEFKDPAYGGSESSQDFSIERELNNGAEYRKTRNVVRSFSGMTLLETRANAFILKHSIFDRVGPRPLAIRLMSHIITDSDFILFAKRTQPPEISYSAGPIYAKVTLGLREVI